MKLDVRYLGLPNRPLIGSLADDAKGRIFFQYDSEWVSHRIELSPLRLPLEFTRPITTPTPDFSPLFGLFDDSLPDWWGQRMMRHHFSELGIPWNKVRPLDMLACQGAFGMGALAYEPDLAPASFRATLTTRVADLIDAARHVLAGDAHEVLPALVRGGLSPGGAQPKALVAFDDDFTHAMAGGGEVPAGFSPWLVKFQLDSDDPIGRAEFAVTRMAAAAGVLTPETRLLESSDGLAHFLTKRFDRRPEAPPLHMHTFAGLTHTPVREWIDYGDLLGLCRELTGRESEVEQAFLRAAFNIGAANDDDHGRNHAFLFDPVTGWRLAPAYDLTRTGYPLGSGFRAAGIGGRHTDLGPNDLRKLGRDQGVRRTDEVLGRVIDTIRRWPEIATEAGLSEAHAAMLAREMPANRW